MSGICELRQQHGGRGLGSDAKISNDKTSDNLIAVSDSGQRSRIAGYNKYQHCIALRCGLQGRSNNDSHQAEIDGKLATELVGQERRYR